MSVMSALREKHARDYPAEAPKCCRKHLQEWVYREAQAGTLPKAMARKFPVAASGGDLDRDLANLTEVIFMRVLIALAVAVVVGAGITWRLLG